MSDTKAAEALIYNNSCFHLFVCSVLYCFSVFWGRCGYKGGEKKKSKTHGGNIIPYLIANSSFNSYSIVSCLSFWHYYCIIKAANFGYSVSFVAPWGREVYYFVFVTY